MSAKNLIAIKIVKTRTDNYNFDEKKFKLTLKNLKDSNTSINYYVKRNILLNSNYLKKNSFYLLSANFFNEANEVVFRSFSQILNKIIVIFFHSHCFSH